jgi:hypothetical protein
MIKKQTLIRTLLLILFAILPILEVYAQPGHGGRGHPPHFHIIFGIIFAIFGVWHIILNWKSLKRYFTRK